MENIIIIAIVLIIIALAVVYVYKAKKSGKKCVGCPDGCCRSDKNGGCSGCNGNAEK